MSKNIYNFEIHKTQTRDWYLASDVDEMIIALQDSNTRMNNGLETEMDRLAETLEELKQTINTSLSEKGKGDIVRFNS